jgi:diguanylate cyclase (GGDEF)-like protein/PAS domain S-box-containing protein
VEQSISLGALPEYERRFRSAFEHAAIGMAIIDRSGTYVFVNQAYCDISGYQDHELYGMAFTATVHPDDAALRLDTFRKILAGELGSFVSERRFIRKDGSVGWVRMSLAVPSDEIRPTHLITLAEDITERKEIEDARRASEERFRIAAENASDLIYEWDLATGEVDVFGPNHQFMGDWPVPLSFDAWKNIVHPEDVERIAPELARYIQSGERYSGEFRIVGQNGKIYYYSNRGQAVRNAAGEPYKWVGLCTDITEARLAEEAISQLAAIVQCSEDAIIATDTWATITTWNDGAQHLLGYTALEAQSRSVADLFSCGDQAREILSRIHQGNSSRLDEAVFRRSDGSSVPVLLSVSPIHKSDGQLIGSAIIARDISPLKKVEQEMAHRALHDHLTGLPNRSLLTNTLAKSISTADREASGSAVVFVDLDGFKFVNDSLGHEAGDALLQQVSERLSGCIRRGDLLARMGGDEFMVVVNGVNEDRIALAVAERLSTSLRTPFLVAHHELVITASIGISIYPRDGSDVSALRRNADAAMYEAKQAGKDRIHFYTPALGVALQARLQMETDLRHALDREELCLHYQPIFTVANRRQTAYEALARWQHPTLGFIPPNQFIPLAEETGLIIRLGEWVLREACRQCRWWQDHGKPLVRVAVNVSALQFARADFVDTVLGVLLETGLTGNLLDLELTESIVMRDVDSAIQKMRRLREHGIRISVDDFGTGYSSLGYLPRLPIDILKIDRCFVSQFGENHAAVPLIHGMISLAHSIGKRVIVEGIENSAQLEILRHLHCDEVQGYLLGRPAQMMRHAERPQEMTTQLLTASGSLSAPLSPRDAEVAEPEAFQPLAV